RDGLQSEVYLLHSFPDRFTNEFFIKGAYPERPLVEKVYAALVKASRNTDVLPDSTEELTPLVGGKVSPREVESCLRIMSQARAIVGSDTSDSVVSVRLIATPGRIKKEITGDANPELGLLRALWKIAGKQLELGAAIDLAALPPGLGRRAGAISLLDSLKSRQFLVWERLGGGLRLTSRHASLKEFPIDWESLDRRRAAELSKLDAMQRYAFTKTCRRGFVLRYFGDPAAKSKCDGCDNCLGTVRSRISTPAPGPRKQPKGRTRVAHVSAPDDAVDLTAADQQLLQVLREKRLEIARRETVPAYIVFSDRTLAEMAVQRPASIAALANVRGVGDVKLERYGEQFLAVIRTSDETETA
ncbi:MAG: HRDC domain-containing protein, partial [Gemmatimonadaceae bacterium]